MAVRWEVILVGGYLVRRWKLLGLFWLVCFCLVFFLIEVLIASKPIYGQSASRTYVVYAISLGPQEFAATGLASVEATVEKLWPGGGIGGSRAEFCWRESRSSLGKPDESQIQYVVKKQEGLEPLVKVEAGGYSHIELTARLTAPDGSVYYTQADFDIYAREDTRSPVSTDQPPMWPFFELKSDQPLYWPQTGQTFFISLKNLDSPPGPLSVWEDGHSTPVAVIEPGPDGSYTYVPPHDPVLDQQGATATKRVVLVHPLADGGAASLSLFLHRSRHQKRNLTVGLGVFGLCLVSTACIMALGRRRVKPCP
jgi:hypothetical protein